MNKELVKSAIIWAAVAALFLLTSPNNAHGAEVAKDKKMHVALSTFLGAAASAQIEGKTEHPVAWSIFAAMVPGIAKEVYDKAHPQAHKAEWGDLAADLVGATAGAWIGHGIYVHTDGKQIGVGVTYGW